MTTTTELIQAPQTFLLTVPPKTFFEQEWVITSFGVLLGFFIGFVATLFKEYLQKRNKIHRLVRNLLNEIGVNQESVKGNIQDLIDTKRRFEAVVAGSSTATPRLMSHDITNRSFYDTYFKDLDLLPDDLLQQQIVHFFNVVRGIEARSKTVSRMFEDYYSGSNTGTTAMDITDQLSKLITHSEKVEEISSEALGVIFYQYKIKKNDINPDEVANFRLQIDSFIKGLESNTIFSLSKIKQETSVGLLTCAYLLESFKNIERLGFGKYKKI